MSKYRIQINDSNISVIREHFSNRHEKTYTKIDILSKLIFHTTYLDINNMTYKFLSEMVGIDLKEYEHISTKALLSIIRDKKIDNILDNE